MLQNLNREIDCAHDRYLILCRNRDSTNERTVSPNNWSYTEVKKIGQYTSGAANKRLVRSIDTIK